MCHAIIRATMIHPKTHQMIMMMMMMVSNHVLCSLPVVWCCHQENLLLLSHCLREAPLHRCQHPATVVAAR